MTYCSAARPRRVARPVLRAALLGLALLAAGCARNPASRPFPQLAEYEGREVRRVTFAGGLVLPRDSLRNIIVTRPTQCRLLLVLPFCIPGTNIGRDRSTLDLDVLAEDVLRLQLYHRDHGYYGTRIAVSVEPDRGDDVEVRFGIAPGDEVVVRSLTVEGTDAVVPAEQVVARLPLAVGEPFRRSGFLASADTIRALLNRRGYAYADVLRNYSIDTIADLAEAQYAAIPGPVVRVDSVVFLGLGNLAPRTARQQLTFRKGDLLQVSELNRSQRNLYALDIVSFAAVEIAPDSLQADADSAHATVVVRVVEAPRYAVDLSTGYGTIDCLRSGAAWTDRDFLGGARRLELSGSVSKVGAGRPLDWGLRKNLCEQLNQDEFSDRLNYRVAADLQQPRLFNTQNQLGVRLHTERVSEFKAYLRQSVGGQLSLGRDLGRQTLLSATLDVVNGYTEASPGVFCITQNVCTEEGQRELMARRWSNSFSLSLLQDRSRGAPGAERGRALRAGVAWASPVLGSEDEYLSLLTEGAGYLPLKPGWVLAGRLQLGSFFIGSLRAGDRFIPPERRFYGGGPNSVRGFERNALGPVAYLADTVEVRVDAESGAVDSIPRGIRTASAGGTQVVVGTLELRTPSPIFPDYLRFATFLDAGQVWTGRDDFKERSLRFTPGIGLRFITPVGPVRVDMAYNGYGSEAGPLYYADPETGDLILLQDGYQRESGSFLQQLQFHFAVGQAF